MEPADGSEVQRRGLPTLSGNDFSTLYVNRSWLSTTSGRYPTWLGIRDVGRRTVEFILRLDAYATALERIAVHEIKRLKQYGPRPAHRPRNRPLRSWEMSVAFPSIRCLLAAGCPAHAFANAVCQVDTHHYLNVMVPKSASRS